MQNNFQSLSYFLPELLIIFTILFVIISDLISDLKKYSYFIAVFGVLCSGLLLFTAGYEFNPKMIFNNMLVFDSFSYYFKSIILFSTLSIIGHKNKSLQFFKNVRIVRINKLCNLRHCARRENN